MVLLSNWERDLPFSTIYVPVTEIHKQEKKTAYNQL